jgi:hypothetical protein
MSEPDPQLESAFALLRGEPARLRQSPQAIWARAQSTVRGPSRRTQLFAFVAAAAVGVFAVVALHPAPSTTRIEPLVSARWHSDSDKSLTLDRGALRVTARGSFTAHTPLTTVFAKDARFLLEVSELSVKVSAEQGDVRVRLQLEGERVLHAGESTIVRAEIAPAARVPPQALLTPEAAAPRSACGEALDCLTRTAKGSSLAAQLALFDLALAARRAHDDDRAVSIWREYLDRFPDGALAPEVSGALVRALVTQAPEAALREAERYHERFGAEPSAGGVELLRAHLLRDVAGRFDEGCALYSALQGQAALAVRSEAVFQTAMCLKARGDVAGAAARLDELKKLAPDSERVRQ